ncbi:MAG: YdcF family protein, partial [Acidimicrobiia bacterium]|nr:YdcF family protein [Acidimicrobiia bacterium]
MGTCRPRWRTVTALTLRGAGVLAAALAVLTEVAYRRQGAGPDIPPAGRGAVVVLGVPGTNPLLRVAQRWRVDLALAAVATGRIDRVVFTGGSVRSERSEAAEMAEIAVTRGLDPALVVLDER